MLYLLLIINDNYHMSMTLVYLHHRHVYLRWKKESRKSCTPIEWGQTKLYIRKCDTWTAQGYSTTS